MGSYLRDVVRLNAESRNFRLMGPDETASNRLDHVFEVTDRVWMEQIKPYDVHLARQGRVMEVLSEHLCQGWLEGYLLTGRHGLFSCYEAFIHIVDSMFNQHANWLKVSRGLPWRQPIASLNYLLTSDVWRQDHNGFSHQDPGFVDLVTNKKADIVRVYLAPGSWSCATKNFNASTVGTDFRADSYYFAIPRCVHSRTSRSNWSPISPTKPSLPSRTRGCSRSCASARTI